MSNAHPTAIITGATSGIGLGLAEAFLNEGYNVVGSGRSAQRLQSAAARLNAGDRFLGVAGDVGKPESARELFAQAIARFGQVDVLVNNAGIFAAKPFAQFTPEEIEEQISTNLKGTLYASQEAAKHMSERKRGKIINITASLAMQPHGSVPALLAVALKGGINQATRALALELAPFGVTVNAVAPGVTDTPMHPAATHAALGSMHPLGRIARIDEVSAGVLYLVNAEFVSGTVLPVDGGFSAGR
ncbi:SDR family NAD(P)-dependent oxidoreductase [Ralstonia pickettii]|uniref:SDR family NAD(P)-dependent oxidoreductase n=1 Tax=Ralstonia pickettii TaxID=329 RepID=UPI0015BFCACD|nr:SDR family NAD(P)-dependent oxidoreductase [Ralstonia pickettii]NWK43439.1 SDR family oxidoreductase [Ralstonia pickettii]